MANLFIIGNGFDIAHGMKTAYSDFRDFLISEYVQDDPDNHPCITPQSYELPDGGSEYNDDEAALAVLKLLDITEGDLWNDIETALGYLDYSEFFSNYGLSSDPEDFKYVIYQNEDEAAELCGAVLKIQDYFHFWIKTIKISKKQLTDFQKLIDPEKDFFLNFNYTKTLETLYNVKNICHIHGTSEKNIYFGHANDNDLTNEHQTHWPGAEDELNRLKNQLRKDTSQAYNKNIKFFKNLKASLQQGDMNIYSYGFSFSDADKFYLRKIFSDINTKPICFYMNDYDKEKKRTKFAGILNECGFEGKISSFHVSKNTTGRNLIANLASSSR